MAVVWVERGANAGPAAEPEAPDEGDLRAVAETARAALPPDVYGFLAGGSGAERTLRANRAAFERVALRPRVLVDVSEISLRTSLFGVEWGVPFGVAPMAYHRLAHPDGEVASAAAAGAVGGAFVSSIFASRTFAEVAAATDGPRWQQLYWLRNRDAFAEVVARAEEAGAGALVLTVDAPRVASRPRDLGSSFTLPDDVRAVNVDPAVMGSAHAATPGTSAIQRHSAERFDPAVTWRDLPWLRARTSLPLLLKGVLTAEDARLAVEHGVDGLIVSNHGGRQLDAAVPSLDALPEIVDAVPGSMPVLLDGGVRRGSDIVVALALGASAVLIGRPVLWGLAAGGREAVTGVLQQLRDQLEECLMLAGRPTIAALDRSAVTVRSGP
ncbi:MAG TPA: alpha-hydroxy acid oxidase [Mycobacteriales bacterium]|jgi:4-hydroxymandelate oxidase|nr:alpha-hydroxy acid oxidase [Mycobacteriales bacterium]